jgi:hypothetical protein
VLKGASGSGKTCILVHRARYLARKYPGQRIAVLTLSETLAGLLQKVGLNITSCLLQKPGNVEALPIPSRCGMIRPSFLAMLKAPFLLEMTCPFSATARSPPSTRSGTGVRVNTKIACRLLLANGVQEVIDLPGLLLVSS